MSCDQKVVMLLSQRRRALSASITELLLLSRFDNISPSVTREKEICHMIWANDILISGGRVPNGTLSMMFTYRPNLLLLASLWLEIYKCSNWSFCYFEQFKIDIHFANIGKSKLTLFVLFYWLWTGHSYFNPFGEETLQKINQKIEEPGIGSGTSCFQWFN